MKMNWARAFDQLKMWPMCCSAEEIAKQTPRESFGLWRQLNEMRKALESVADPEKAARESPPARKDAEPSPSPMKPKKEGQGMSIIGGVNFSQYECMKPTQSEKDEVAAGRNPDLNPFCLPRGIARQRTYAMVREFASQGQLEHLGVKANNEEAMRDWIDIAWAENSRIFDAVKAAVTAMPEHLGREALDGMKRAGDLGNYKAPPGVDLYDHLRECAERSLKE